MPKATVDEEDGVPPWKSHIWTTWQVRSEQAEPEAEAMRGAPHDKLWLGVLAADGLHIA